MPTSFFSPTRSIMPVTTLDGQPIGAGAPGPITQELGAAYEKWLSGVE